MGIVGIVDKKDSKQTYPCYIFETQQIVNATAAQLTYPDLEANNKKKLQDLLEDVISQKKKYQLNLAERAEEEQAKISAAMPNVIFDTNNATKQQIIPSTPSSNNETPQIVIQSPPKDLYQTDDNINDNLLIESEAESSVPKGYALVPVSTLNEVVNIKNQKDELQKKEIELISKQNELSLAEKEKAIALKKKEMEIQRKQKEIEMDQKNLHSMEHDIQNREKQNDQKYEEEIRRKQRHKERERRKSEKKKRNGYDDEDDRDRKRKKKKKKRKKKDEGCTTGKCCKCLIKKASIFIIIALIAGLVGAYFYFIGGEDQNLYAFGAWAGAILAFVFGGCFWLKS